MGWRARTREPRRTRAPWGGIFWVASLATAACGVSPKSNLPLPPDGAEIQPVHPIGPAIAGADEDAGLDASVTGVDAGEDAGLDAGQLAEDAGLDAGVTGADGGADSGFDAGAARDAGLDAGLSANGGAADGGCGTASLQETPPACDEVYRFAVVMAGSSFADGGATVILDDVESVESCLSPPDPDALTSTPIVLSLSASALGVGTYAVSAPDGGTSPATAAFCAFLGDGHGSDGGCSNATSGSITVTSLSPDGGVTGTFSLADPTTAGCTVLGMFSAPPCAACP